MTSVLKKEFDFYRANQDEMVAKYDGKVIAIKDGEVLGVFEDYLAAVTKVRKSHALGTFLVQRVSEGDEAYTMTIVSPRRGDLMIRPNGSRSFTATSSEGLLRVLKTECRSSEA